MPDRQPSRPVGNLLGLAVLSYLTQRPMHPYELNRQLRDNDAAATFKLSYGALYSVVRQLARAGLIAEAGSGRTGNLPQHTAYELTDAGRAELRDWLRELLAEPRHEYPAFAAALSLVVVLPPREVADLLAARLARIAAVRADVVGRRDGAVAGGVPPLFLVEVDYRVALLDAERDFIADLLATITDPAAGWTEHWEAYHAGGAIAPTPAPG